MVNDLVLNSSEIKPPCFSVTDKLSLSEAVAKQFRTYYGDCREKIAIQTAQDGMHTQERRKS